MAVTSKTVRSTQRSHTRASGRSAHLAAYVATIMLAALAAAVIGNLVLGKLRTTVDDIRYGRPRTTHLEGYVEHGDAPGRPTHFVALNLNRQVTIIELPGGDASKARTIPGPYLFGADEDLTPVTLTLHDMDGDGVVDLLVEVRQEQVVYLNRDGSFRLPTPDEQARLILDHNP